MRRRPVAARPADAQKIPDQLRSQRRVVHLGMELHRPDAALLVGDSGQRVLRHGHAAKSRRQLLGFVAVAHPHLDRRRQPGKQLRCAVFNLDFGMTVLALRRRAHLAAQVMHDEVQPVANAERRHAHRQHARVGIRRVGIVHRRRPARKNQADRLVGFDFAQRRSAGQHHGKNILLADAARNQLRILRSEIEDDDGLGVHAPVWQGAGRNVKNCKATNSTRMKNSLINRDGMAPSIPTLRKYLDGMA